MTGEFAPVAPPPGPASPRRGRLAAEVVGRGLARIAPEQMPQFRRKPGPIPAGWDRVSPSLLRYSDEQTIAGVASVFAAVEAMGGDPARFEGWGVVAAPRFLGRANLAVVLRRFAAEGVWGTSPHLIPHFALHSASGTISLALNLRGPNLGTGGGLHAPAEGFLTALSWLEAGVVPGVWLVLTGWSPDLGPGPDGPPVAAGECQALALALVADSAGSGPRFRLTIGGVAAEALGPVDLPRLDSDLSEPSDATTRTIATDPSGGLRVDWIPAGFASAEEGT